MNPAPGSLHAGILRAVLATSLLLTSARAQQAKPDAMTSNGNLNASLTELQTEVHELKDLVQQLKQETTASRAEITRLRQELEAEHAATVTTPAISSESQTGERVPVDIRVGQLEEEQQLLSGKVDEQHQTKVESASKYRIRLTGIALFNLFSNQGAVDNMDVPELAYHPTGLSSGGSFGG